MVSLGSVGIVVFALYMALLVAVAVVAARFGGVAGLPFISFAVASLIIVRFFAKKLRMMAGFTPFFLECAANAHATR